MHSKFSASAAHRWVRCPGSLALTEEGRASGQVSPKSSSAAAEEGTMLHDRAEKLLLSNHDADTMDDLTAEQQQVLQECVDAVRDVPGDVRLYEVRSDYSRWLGVKSSDGFGTADVVILDGDQLHVMDHKFGRYYVGAQDNPQMELYALGVLDAVEDLGDKVKDVFMHILQPRTKGTQEPYHLTRAELVAKAKKFKAAAKKAEETWEDNLHPSEDACHFCPAKAICPALREVAMEKAVDPAGVDEFNDDQLAEVLEKAELIKLYLKAVEEEAYRRLEEGKRVKGYKLIEGRLGNRKWGKDDEAIKKYLGELGIDPEESKVLSPSKAEKALTKVAEGKNAKERKAAAKAMLDGYVVRSPGKAKMVPESAPGKPIGPATMDEFD